MPKFNDTTIYGDLTVNGSITGNINTGNITNDAVTNAKLANMAVNTIKGRVTTGTGDPEDLTAAQVRSILNVANGATANNGTVTSVGLSVPTGLSVTGSPITTTGTLAISLTSGYSIPTTTKQGQWDTAHGWGNHASAGYLKTAVTSVGLSVPTGLSVTGSPITTSGTLAISLASGYSIPTTTKQGQWDTAHGWGNHASAGYLTSIPSHTHDINSGTSGTLGVARGGTGRDSLTDGAFIIGAGTSAVTMGGHTTGTRISGTKYFTNLDLSEDLNFASDERVKNKIKKIDTSELSDIVDNVDIWNYNYINNDISKIGLMAQDLEESSGDLADLFVNTEDYNEEFELENFKSIKQDKLVYILWGALQKANERIYKLEQLIKEVK